MNPHDHTKAAIKYFLSKDGHKRVFYTRLEKLYFKSKHIAPYRDQIQSGGDLSSIIDSIREDLYDPIREEEAIKDMIICTAMEPEFLKYVSTKYHYRVTSEPVKQNGWVLAYASAELQGDREIVLEAVKNDRLALQYASAELQRDREIVLEAVKQSGYALQYASAELQGDREIVLEAVKKNGYSLRYASAELKGDREVVLEAVRQNGYTFRYASAELQGDREIVLEAVKNHGRALQYASAEYQRDPETIRASYLSCPLALKYSKGIYSYDPMFIFECLKRDARCLFYLNRTEKEDLFNKLSSYLRRRIDYLSSVLGDDDDYFFDDNEDYVSGDELEKVIPNRYLEFIEKAQKQALNELADMFSCELFYDDKRKNDLHKQLQICEGSEVGATIASYLSVKGAVSTMRVCKSGLFSKGLPDEEDRGNANKYRKIND